MPLYTDRADPAVARAIDEKLVGSAERQIRLVMHSSPADGVPSAPRVKLRPGDPDAALHHHNLSADVLIVWDGAMEFRADDEVLSAQAGDLLVVPTGMPHAFGVRTWITTERLVIVRPGVQGFACFRQLVDIHLGAEPADG